MSTVYAQIERLTPKLQKMAALYAQSSQDSADDLYQDAVIHLIERQAADPTFVNQNDSYILDAARKRVFFPSIRHNAVVNKHITPEPAELEDSDTCYFDTFASDAIDPEQALENLEEALSIAEALRALSGREVEVLTLAVAGVGTGEIAAKFGCSPAAVSCYKNRIAAKVRAVLQ